MLAEIKCDKFIEEPIIFKSGLNSILGDDYSTNSIGKSTLLMIIDFVLGGNSFIDNNSGAINKLGHLVFKFKFKFQLESLYFIRTTSDNNKIGICDNEYNIIIRKHHFAYAGTFTAKVNTLIQVIESNLNNVVEFI